MWKHIEGIPQARNVMHLTHQMALHFQYTMNWLTWQIISKLRPQTNACSTIVFSFLLLHCSNSTCSFLDIVNRNNWGGWGQSSFWFGNHYFTLNKKGIIFEEEIIAWLGTSQQTSLASFDCLSRDFDHFKLAPPTLNTLYILSEKPWVDLVYKVSRLLDNSNFLLKNEIIFDFLK